MLFKQVSMPTDPIVRTIPCSQLAPSSPLWLPSSKIAAGQKYDETIEEF
jgi:hypothetical protein